MIIYHLSPCREFKAFYQYFLVIRHKSDFREFLSYNRFVELMPTLLVPLLVMIHCLCGKKDGIYFIDSSKMQICNNKRTNSNRVFKGLAGIGKSSYGWFMGFKLHLIINTKGQIIADKKLGSKLPSFRASYQNRDNCLASFSFLSISFSWF
jgi:hypothetical protein